MPVTLTYYGHSTFGLFDGSTHVLVDPFLDHNPAATVKAADVEADVILITHAHGDHCADVFAVAERTQAPVITVNEFAAFLTSRGVKNVSGGNHGGTVKFTGGSAKFTQAWHSSSYSEDGQWFAPGVPAGFVVRFGGKVIYFAGDTGLFGDMALIGEEGLDLAVLPIGDNFTMGPDDAVRAAKLLNAKTVIPCHFNTFPLVAQDGAAFVAAVESQTSSKAVELKPNGQFTLE